MFRRPTRPHFVVAAAGAACGGRSHRTRYRRTRQRLAPARYVNA